MKYAIPNVTHSMVRICGMRLISMAEAYHRAALRNDEKTMLQYDRAMMIEIDLLLRGISCGAGHALRKARDHE
jgi:hypothetical protein